MFQFFFQSGDFVGNGSSFLHNLFVQLLGTGFGAAAAAAFALWLHKKQLNDKENEKKGDSKKVYSEKLEYFKHVVSNSKRYGDDLLATVQRLIKELDPNIPSIGQATAVAWDDLKRAVDIIDRETIYHAWVEFKIDTDVRILFLNLDTLNRIRIQFTRLHKYRFKQVAEREKELSFLLQDINILLKSFTQEDAEEIPEECIKSLKMTWTEFDRKIANLVSKNRFNKDIDLIENTLLATLLRTMRCYFDIHSFLHNKITDLLRLIYKTGVCTNNIREIVENYSKDLEGIEDSVAKCLSESKPIIESLEIELSNDK